MANKKAVQFILLLAVFAVFVVVLSVLNIFTAPRIAANADTALYEPLYAVMADAKGFTQLGLSTPDTVRSVWKETSGKGYVVRLATNKGYTGDYIEFSVAVSSDGKISGVNLESYPESKDFGTSTYPKTYIGEDSAMANVQIVAGVTYSSSAFKGAVADAFQVLIDNGLVGAGVKEMSQIVLETIPVVNADMCSATGQLQAQEFETSLARQAWASDSGRTVAFWIETSKDYLVIIDTDGNHAVYDLASSEKVSDAAATAQADKAYDEYLTAQAGQDLAEISALIEGAAGFRKLNVTGAADTVKSVWEETSGKGYVVRSTTNKGFTGEYINLSVAFTKDGRISNIQLESYPETRDFGDGYPATYIGQDSTLSGAVLVAGVTYSSSAFKGAVADAFQVLIDNGLVVEAVKDPSQVISEMIPVKASGMATPKGIAQLVELATTESAVVAAWGCTTGNDAAYWISNGSDYLALVNMSGSITVYDLDGNDVTASQPDVVAIASAESAGDISPTVTSDKRQITKLLPADAVVEQIPAEGIYSSVSTAFKAVAGSDVYYCFACRTYGFGNEKMTYYYVIDSEGRIAGMNASALIIEAEFFSVKVNKADYVAAMTGISSDWTGEEAFIAGATLTTEATQTTVRDAFAAYELLAGGAN